MSANPAQLPNEIELARLRAAAADLQRLRAELARTGHSNILAAAQSAASNRIEPEPFTLDGTVRLNFGETVLSGGWSRTEGKRLFSLMTPTLEDGGHIMIAARLVEIPETAWETFGLKNLTSDTRAAEHFSTFTPELAANFMHLLEQMDGVAVLTSPRIVTNPGSEATISIGGNADTNEAGITLAFTPQIQPDGNSLDMAMKVRLPQPKAKNAP